MVHVPKSFQGLAGTDDEKSCATSVLNVFLKERISVPMIQEMFTKQILIFGSGNTLFGDDGFGPAVIEHLTDCYTLPDTVLAADVGTGICDLLFDLLLSPLRPETIIIVDAVSVPGRQPGEVFEMELSQMPASNAGEFSLHQFPSVNLLREMNDSAGVKVRILAVQVKEIPESVHPGLSPEVQGAVDPACQWLMKQWQREPGLLS